MRLRLCAAAIACAAAMMTASNARAQAFVGPENSLTASLGYTFGTSGSLIESNGKRLTNLPVQYHLFTLAAEYVTPLEGLAVDAQLPFVGMDFKPNGMAGATNSIGPSTPHGPWDDGSFHGTPTDLRVGARYQLLADPLAATVGIAGSIPTHAYPIQGFAAPGRHLAQLHLMGALGKTFDPWLPHLFAQVTYEFSIVQRLSGDTVVSDIQPGSVNLSDPAASRAVHRYNNNHTDISVRVGYYILEELEVDLDFDGRIANGGLDFIDYGKVPQVVRDYHDAIIAETVFLFGAGVGYEITERVTLTGYFRAFLTGTNVRNSSLFGASVIFGVL